MESARPQRAIPLATSRAGILRRAVTEGHARKRKCDCPLRDIPAKVLHFPDVRDALFRTCRGIPIAQFDVRKENTMAGKRELIEPHPGDKRYVRRNEKGQFSEVEDVGRSSAQDQKRHAASKSKPGQGDRGDRS
jgi:hypothetical protein